MKHLLHLMKWDVIHLLRNQMLAVAIFLGLLYYVIIYLIKDLGNVDAFIILIIYNDPVITGYSFAGVLLLFERNQNTLEAMAVSPMQLPLYLWSKAVVLSVLALIISFCMALAAHGWCFNFLHFSTGVVGATLLSCFCGFALTAPCTGFNGFIARSIPFFLLFALPFLGLFDIFRSAVWYFIPTYPGLLLIKSAFMEVSKWDLIYAYGVSIAVVAGSYYYARYRVKKYMAR